MLASLVDSFAAVLELLLPFDAPITPSAMPANGTMGHVKRPYETGRFAEVGDLGQVNSRPDVAQVVHRMLDDLLAHPDEWENPTLGRFLEALTASLEGLPRVYANRGEQFPEAPTWKVFAEALVMATGYE